MVKEEKTSSAVKSDDTKFRSISPEDRKLIYDELERIKRQRTRNAYEHREKSHNESERND